MENKTNIIFGSIFLVVTILLGAVFAIGWISATLLGLGAVAVTSMLLSSAKGQKTRIIVFCAWGLIFAGLVIASNVIQHGYFICPSKFPIVGQNAGVIPTIPDTNVAKGVLPCPFGMAQNYTTSFMNYGFSFSIIVLGTQLFGAILFIWLAIALVFGRSWCGWICPFGGIVEAFSRIGSKPLWNLNMSSGTARALRYGFLFGVIFLTLAATSAPAFYYCLVCPMKGVLHSPDYWGQILIQHVEFISFAAFILLFLVVPFLTKKRVWCALLCPLGALTSLVGSFSLLTTRIDESKCVNCKMCMNNCRLLAVSQKDKNISINQSNCANCGECMNVCPKEAIKYYIRGTNREVKNAFIPIIVICSIIAAVILVSVMWKPVFTLLLK